MVTKNVILIIILLLPTLFKRTFVPPSYQKVARLVWGKNNNICLLLVASAIFIVIISIKRNCTLICINVKTKTNFNKFVTSLCERKGVLKGMNNRKRRMSKQLLHDKETVCDLLCYSSHESVTDTCCQKPKNNIDITIKDRIC